MCVRASVETTGFVDRYTSRKRSLRYRFTINVGDEQLNVANVDVTDDVVVLAATEMASRPYCLLLTLAAITVNYLDCDTDISATLGRTHLRDDDVMDDATSWTACQNQLSDDIEACLSGYERFLVSSRALDTTPGQIRRPVARRLCRLVRRYDTVRKMFN